MIDCYICSIGLFAKSELCICSIAKKCVAIYLLVGPKKKETNYSSDGRAVKASVRLGSCRLEFDSESGQTNDFNIGIHSFPA